MSIFCSRFYCNNVLIKPVLGNQQYDAEVIKWGRIIEKIEITKPNNGKAESDDLNLVTNRGFGQLSTKTPLAKLREMEPYLEKTADKKSQKNYSGAMLVFIITYPRPFSALEEEIDIQHVLSRYAALLSQRKYMARKVLIFDSISGNLYSIQRGNFCHWLLGLVFRK